MEEEVEEVTRRVVWTQALCEGCFAAWLLGQGEPPKQPTRLIEGGDPCLVCGTPTGIYVRIDPVLAAHYHYARREGD